MQSTQLRCEATGGYYRHGYTEDDLVREMAAYVEQGFTAVKLKVGELPAPEDAARLARVRRELGDDVDVLRDANGGWPDAPTAIAEMRRLEEYRPYRVEEPVRADNISAMIRIAEALDTPVATAELESIWWAFADLIARKGADILQPDASVCGGASEWLKIASTAVSYDIPVVPHYNRDIHTQLLATTPNGRFIEYFAPAAPGAANSTVKIFDKVLENPLYPKPELSGRGRIRGSASVFGRTN